MINIWYLLHRRWLLVARQKLYSGFFAPNQSLTQPKNILGTAIHPFEPNCLPSHSIIKSFKSSDAKNRNLDDKPTKRRYSPEGDKQILENVNAQGKGSISLKRIAESLGLSYVSVRNGCGLLLSDNEYDPNTDHKHWNPEEDEKLFGITTRWSIIQWELQRWAK